jgi:hypothetical protein
MGLTNTYNMFHSILSNHTIIEGFHPIGSTVNTQWGPRVVMSHLRISIEIDHITEGEIASGTQ